MYKILSLILLLLLLKLFVLFNLNIKLLQSLQKKKRTEERTTTRLLDKHSLPDTNQTHTQNETVKGVECCFYFNKFICIFNHHVM